MTARPDDSPGPAGPPNHALLDGASLFLDFDGTLVTLAERPDAVVVDDRLLNTLKTLNQRLNQRLAIVTGRPVAGVRALLQGVPFAIAGSHGTELEWSDGRRHAASPPPWIDAAADAMHGFSRDHPGVLVEVKPFGVALHYRRVPDAEEACHRLAEGLMSEDGIHLQKGKMMVELRAAGADKGDALRAFMADPHMAGTRPLMLGDDLTDEPAFVAAAAFGGAGILIGAPRDSAARYRLPHVAATLDWLDQAAELLP